MQSRETRRENTRTRSPVRSLIEPMAGVNRGKKEEQITDFDSDDANGNNQDENNEEKISGGTSKSELDSKVKENDSVDTAIDLNSLSKIVDQIVAVDMSSNQNESNEEAESKNECSNDQTNGKTPPSDQDSAGVTKLEEMHSNIDKTEKPIEVEEITCDNCETPSFDENSALNASGNKSVKSSENHIGWQIV